MTLLEEAFAVAGLGMDDGTGTKVPPKDAYFSTTCPACGTPQTLAEATPHGSGGDTEYTCKNGCGPIVVVGPAPGLAGYSLGRNVVHNVAEMRLSFPSFAPGEQVIFPPPPEALPESPPSG